MTAPVEIYRLRLVKGTTSSSCGDWKLYDNREDFERDLLEALVEAGARDHRNPHFRVLSGWRRALKLPDEPYGINRVAAAEQLVDGQWVDLQPRLVPPSVNFAAQAQSPAEP